MTMYKSFLDPLLLTFKATLSTRMSGGKPDVMQIACAFAEEYYKTIATSYLASLPFYGPIARVCVGGTFSPVPAQTFEGKSTITAHLQHLDQTTSPRKLVIVNLDAVSAPNSVVVTVAGKILMPHVDRTFNQVFLLANQHGHDTYYIAAEVLRFTEEVKHEPRHAPVSVQASAAPRTHAAPVHTATASAAPHGSHSTASHPTQTHAHPHSAPSAVLPSPTQKVPVFEENDEDERRKTPPPPAVPAPRRRQEELKAEAKKTQPEPPKPKSAAAEARAEEKNTKSEPKRSSADNKEKSAPASTPPAKETKKDAPQPKSEKSATPANKKVVLFNVPDGATVKDVEYYTEPFGKIESISWMSSRHTIVEFKYLEDAKSLVGYDQFTMFRKPVRRDFFREDKAAAPRESAPREAAPREAAREAAPREAAPKKDKPTPKPRSQEKQN
jgi:hypothetical protein